MTVVEEVLHSARHAARVIIVGAVVVALAVGGYFAFGQSSLKHVALDVSVPAGLPQTTLSADDIQAMLKAHNDLRTQYGQAPLTWNNDLASLAQDWANQMAQSGVFDHRPNNKYGENLYVGGYTGDTSTYTPQQAVDSWGSEVQFFDKTTNTCPDFHQCGHFTQVVWGTTTAVGCGRAQGKNNNWGDTFKADYWVCNYDPAGNLTNNGDNSVKPFG